MRHLFLATAPIIAALLAATPLAAAVRTGAPAPDFQARDANGKLVRLSDYRGKTIVLEWNNPGCPFVQKHYRSGNMQKTQAAARETGAVWLTVNSGAPGKQGHMDGPQALAWVKEQGAEPTAYLLDPRGAIGHGYGATATPHMYVIDKSGRLRYQGAIDSKATADPADIKTATNYVLTALQEIDAGKPVTTPQSQSYGCSVKYAS